MVALRAVLRAGARLRSRVAVLLGSVLGLWLSASTAAGAPPFPAVPPEWFATSTAEVTAGDSLQQLTIEKSSTPPRRRFFSFEPHPGNEARMYLMAEGGASYLGHGEHTSDQWLVTNGFGLMVNSGRWAFGGGLEWYWTRAHWNGSFSLRCRRWFANTQSLELAATVVEPDPEDVDLPRTRLDGPMISLRYSPKERVFLQAGVCRLRETTQLGYDLQNQPVTSDHDFWKGSVGLGMSGRGAAAVWANELLIAGLVALGRAIVGGIGEHAT